MSLAVIINPGPNSLPIHCSQWIEPHWGRSDTQRPRQPRKENLKPNIRPQLQRRHCHVGALSSRRMRTPA